MSYLNPPPSPAPVVVVRDVGGIVKDYQAQTDFYRRTGREVRLHECRSACTMALSLPNVCVYPDSILKFHQAYNLRSRQTDYGVSEQLFDAYPPAIRARLGTLTRDYHVMTGSELIALGIRNCNEPKIMLASKSPARAAEPPPSSLSATLSGTWTTMMAALKPGETGPANSAGAVRSMPPPPHANTAEVQSGALSSAAVPLPPERPASHEADIVTASTEAPPRPEGPEAASNVSDDQDANKLPEVIVGAQPILPSRFTAFVQIAKLMR